MSTVTWKGGVGNWDGSNWSTGQAPGVGDTASVSTGIVDVTNYTDNALGLSLTGGTIAVAGQLAVGTGTLGQRTGAITNSGGTLSVADFGSITVGQYVTSASGTVSLDGEFATYQWGGSGSTQDVDFSPAAVGAQFQFLTNFGGTVSNFAAGQSITYSTTNAITKVVVGNDIVEFFDAAGEHDVHFVGNYDSSNLSVSDNTITTDAICYCTGTLIRTARGDVAVEDLQVGDLAVTTSGAHRPIRWIGSRTLDPRRHPRPREAMPVRVAAGALGPNRPARDLRVSPGHALCLDLLGEVLVPACALVNGATIVQEPVERVTYWHVELDGHDVILAENQPAESYLEMGNRGFFADGAVVVDLAAGPDAPVPTHAAFCRPFHAEGALVEVVRGQLRARAEVLGWRLASQGLGDLHVVADGCRVEPEVDGLAARFVLPGAARDVWLASSAGVPRETGLSADERRLGVCVGGLTVEGGVGAPRRVAPDDARLGAGFHAAERGSDGACWRWTDGRALLPAELWAGVGGEVTLHVELTGPALPRWMGPGVEVAAVQAA